LTTETKINLIENIEVKRDKLTVNVSSALKPDYIKNDFWIRVVDADINNVPLEIVMIPFILNIAPVVWISGLTFELDTIDKTLDESLKDLKKSLSDMYPEVEWKGNIVAKNKRENAYSTQENSSTLLFSGGLDSVATSYKHNEETQTLVTVMGADVTLDDINGWNRVQENTKAYAKNIDAKYYFVESNFIDFLNQNELSSIAKVPTWWGYVQHGMGLSALIAIPAYLSSSSIGYIASSHSKKFYSKPWGSHPKIDNYIKWANLHIEHDCYDLTRQEKVELVVDRVEKGYPKPYLRVCYFSTGGENCGQCEKCCRTMTGLVISGTDFRDYGFKETDFELVENTQYGLQSQKFHFDDNALYQWQDIQVKIKEHSFYNKRSYSQELLTYIIWLKDFDFQAYKENQEKKKKFSKKIKDTIQMVSSLFLFLKTTKSVTKNKQ
jgi:hypothetical protein